MSDVFNPAPVPEQVISAMGAMRILDAEVTDLDPLMCRIGTATESVRVEGAGLREVGERGLVLRHGTRVVWLGGHTSPEKISQDMVDLDEALVQARDDLSQLELDMGDLEGSLDGLDSSLAGLGSSLADLDTALDEARTDLANAIIAVEAQDGRIDDAVDAIASAEQAAQNAHTVAAAASTVAQQALDDAAAADTKGEDAYIRADAAHNLAGAAQTAADSAEALAQAAQGQAATAASAAAVAQAAATAAQSEAQSAQAGADAAGAVAQAAQSDAAIAAAAAADAAGIGQDAQDAANAAQSAADTAQDAADAAAADAIAKAAAAEQAAKDHADAQAAAAEAAAIAAASGDASDKAAAAQAAAEATAAADAADKANAALEAAKIDATNKADAAAAIANSKADVLIQSSAPAVAMRKDTTLWIDTTDGNNTPKRWNGSEWAEVTDKAAKDAADAAAAAQTAADDAADDAAEALQAAADSMAEALAAQSAADAADGKATTANGRITIAAANPTASDASGKPIGALWEVRSGSTVLRRYVLTGATTWTQVRAGQDFIGANAIGSAQIADAAVGTLQVAEGAITNAKIGDATIEHAKIKSVNADDITTGTLNADRIAANAIVAAKLAAGAVTTLKLAAGAVTSEKIEAAAVTTQKLDALAVTASKIATNAVTTDKLNVNAVTANKLSADSATINKIAAAIGQFDSLSGVAVRGARIYSPDDTSLPRLEIDGPSLAIVRDDGDGGELVTTSLGGATSDRLTLRDGSGSTRAQLDAGTGTGMVSGRFTAGDLVVGGDSWDEIQDRVPKGVVALMRARGDSPQAGTSGIVYIKLTARTRTDRLYRLTVDGMLASNTAGDTAQVYFRTFEPSSFDLQTGNFPITKTTAENVNMSMVFPGRINGVARFALMFRNATANRGVFWSGRAEYPVQFYLEDLGPRQYNIGDASAMFDLMGTNPLVAGATDNETPVSEHVKVYNATHYTVYRGSSAASTSTLEQGWYSPSQRYSTIGFSGSLGTDIAGATIKKAEVRLRNEHWWDYAGGTVRVGSTTSLTARSTSGTTIDTHMSRYADRWVPVGGFTTASRGVTLGAGATQSNTFYGKFAKDVQLRVTYEK